MVVNGHRNRKTTRMDNRTRQPQRNVTVADSSAAPLGLSAPSEQTRAGSCWDWRLLTTKTNIISMSVIHIIHILYISHHISTFSHKWLTLNCQLLWCSWKQLSTTARCFQTNLLGLTFVLAASVERAQQVLKNSDFSLVPGWRMLTLAAWRSHSETLLMSTVNVLGTKLHGVFLACFLQNLLTLLCFLWEMQV